MSITNHDHYHQFKALTPHHKSYRCTVSGCRTVLSAALLIGRVAECPNCKETLIINRDNLRRSIITHIGCGAKPGSRRKSGQMKLNIKSLLSRTKELL